jgi:hypothetical protein
LDVKGGDLETAKAALIELATEDGKALYQAVRANGRRLGLFQTPQEAARAVERVVGNR